MDIPEEKNVPKSDVLGTDIPETDISKMDVPKTNISKTDRNEYS